MSKQVFKEYARFYDELYSDKNYNGECAFVEKTIRKKISVKKKAISILDLGCGTGNHALILNEKGFNVTGVDISGDMVRIAREKSRGRKGLAFVRKNIRDFHSKKKFDAVIMLFSVIGYLVKNNDLEKTINAVSRHLKPNGIFIFDFWYGPAVLWQKPGVKEKKIDLASYDVKRKSEPELFENENRVRVNFTLDITKKKTKQKVRVAESHNVRYFFYPELENLLSRNGFVVSEFSEWMTGKKCGIETWNAVIVAKK